MYYPFTFTIAANTALINAEEHKLIVPVGYINLIRVYFPEGCHRLLRCQILINRKVKYPNDEDLYIKGNASSILIPTYHPILEGDKLVLKVWNVDDAKQHTIDVDISVEDSTELFYKRKASFLIPQFVDIRQILHQIIGET